MVALGPRVGRAHVDVNLKFDDGSLKEVGKRIHRQLASIGDRNRRVYQRLGSDAVTAWRAALGATVASAPLMGSLISGVAGSATMLAGALHATVQSAYGLAPLLTAIGVAAGTAAIGMNGFVDAVKTGKMGDLTPSAASAARAVRSLKGAWESLRDTVQERMFAGLADDIRRLGSTLFPVLETGLGKMADSLNNLAQSMLDYLNSSAGLKVIGTFLDNAADIFDRFAASIVPFLDGFLRLMNALSPAAKRLADRITDIAERFQSWTQAEGFGKRINDMMKRSEKTAGLLFSVLGNLGGAIQNIFNTINPSTNNFLQMLVGVTQRFQDWTESAGGQNSLVTWADQSIDVMRQLGRTFESVFGVLEQLADPRVIISFLRTVEGAFDYLARLPLESMVDGFVRIAEVLQPVSSLFLAIIVAGAAFNILLGSLIGQFGGLVSLLTTFLKFKIVSKIFTGMSGGAGAAGAAAGEAAKKTGLLARAWEGIVRLFQRIGGLFRSVIGFLTGTGKAAGDVTSKASKLGKVFKPVLSVLGRIARVAGLAGLVVWIGSVIAGSENLQKKFGKVWDSIKGVWDSVKGAFTEIGDALKPLAPAAGAVGDALGPVFEVLDKIMGLAIGVVLDTIAYAFKSLANVIKGAGKIIAGLINVLVGLFTLDFGKVWDGLKQTFSGIGPLLQGVIGLILTVFAPARLAGLALRAFRGLLGGITRAVPGILSAVGNMLKAILGWIGRLPGQLLSLGGRAIAWLARAVVRAAPRVLKAAGNIVKGVIGWIARLPGRLLTLGKNAVNRLKDAVAGGVPGILRLAGDIVKGVLGWIGRLPGRLFDLGKNAIQRLATALKNGLGRLKSIAGRVVNAIWDKLKGLPGEMLKLGGDLMGKLAEGITNGIKKVGGALEGAAKKVIGFLPGSPVKEGPLRAWNYGSDATGGGRNVIDAITRGLRQTGPIERAMKDVASTVSGSLNPRLAGAGVGAVGATARTQPQDDQRDAGGGNIYIGNLAPHDYTEFRRELRAQQRLAALGGRRVVGT